MGVCRYFALAILVATATAHANPIEVFGLTSRRAGQANSGVAAADDASALYYDPAGLVARGGGELVLGTLAAYSHLSINASRASLSDPIGFQIGVRAHVPLGGALADRIAVGLGLHLLPTLAARVIAPAPDAAFYPYYGDRLSRIVVLPGAAARITDAFSVGAALNVLAGFGGTITATDDAMGGIDARVDEQQSTVARLIAGIRYTLSPSFSLGAVYRQRFEIPVQATAHTMVAGEAIDVDVRAAGSFTPHQFFAGVAYTTDALVASLDLGYARWSDYAGPYVTVVSQLPVVGAVPGESPLVPFEDTFTVRAGLESAGDGLVFRGGYGLETAAVPRSQSGVTNLLDGTKHIAAFGMGYVWKRIRVDAHLQLQLVSTRKVSKELYDGTGEYDPFTSLRDEDANLDGTQISNPGYPSMKSGGEVVSGGVTLGVSL